MLTPLHRRAGTLMLCAAVVWLPAHAVEAADFTCTGGDVPCLIAAINASNANTEMNTIHLDASTYSLTAAEANNEANGFPVIVGQVAISGVTADATIIELATSLTVCCFRTFSVATTGRLVLDHLTVRGNRQVGLGAIRSQGALTIRSCAIINHSVYGTGAIDIDGGTLVMIDTLVARNFSGYRRHNHQDRGSRRSVTATATIARSKFSDNLTDDFVVVVELNGSADIVDSAIVRNPLTVLGQAVGAYGRLTIMNTTIAENRSSFSFSLPSGVVAGGNGVAVIHSTIAGTVYGPARIQNSIVTGVTLYQCISLGHNVFEQPQGCGPLAPDDLNVGVGGARLGSLIEAGTLAYLPLLADSPAIDVADSAACPSTDQRRLHRPIDGNGDGTRACDAGATEFYPIVNDLLRLDAVSGEYVPPSENSNPLTAGGEFHINAAFTNVDPRDICHVAFDVVTLNGAAPPVVLTPAGLLIGGQGAAVTAAAASAPADLASQAQQQYQFRIGVPQPEEISFLVNVLGEATAGSCAP